MPVPSSLSNTEHALADTRPWAAPHVARLCDDEARLAALLRDNFTMVWRALRRLGVSQDAADDAAQEVFIIAARRLAEVERGRERPYVYGIALRVAANVRRAKRRSLEHSDEDAIAAAFAIGTECDTLLDEKQWRALLENILDKMPEELRNAFVLFEFEGFTEREIAELCSVPQGTVASRLRRARLLFHEGVQRLKLRLSVGGS
ncbi:MAG TPA: sigma-70 family RNA polymerase sigma factor, partial [Polyangiaceae bacterium]|nr:sigma-70 family RNA polymerase sigma factor [Polyangiaceae bacterium]